MPIVPDEKDWTWVLGRACPDCRFDASACVASEVPLLVRENAAVWRALLADGSIRPGRPDDSTWSTLEYTCHVRDVYRRYRVRLDLMLTEHDPLFANWDQDASAVQDSYDAQDAATVVDELANAAEALAVQLDSVSGSDWERPGRRSDGASFTVATIARYMVHDPIHHVWDVRQQHNTQR
jgi:hypothetical protein